MWGAVDIKEQNELFASVHFYSERRVYLHFFQHLCCMLSFQF